MAQAVGQGRVHVHGLARLERPSVGREGRQRSHVVQAVGELDDHHADVLAHGQEHLTQVEGLLLVHRGNLDGGELGHAVNELRDDVAKALAQVVEGRGGVLHGVVEQGGADGVLVHVEVLGQDQRHLDGVVDVGLARAPLLVAVEVCRKLVRGRDLGQLLGREVRGARVRQDAPVVRLGCVASSRDARRAASGLHAHDSSNGLTLVPNPGVMGLLMRASNSSGLLESTQSLKLRNASRDLNPSR